MFTTKIGGADVNTEAANHVVVGLTVAGREVRVEKARQRGFKVVIEGSGVQPPSFEGFFLNHGDAVNTALRWLNEQHDTEYQLWHE